MLNETERDTEARREAEAQTAAWNLAAIESRKEIDSDPRPAIDQRPPVADFDDCV